MSPTPVHGAGDADPIQDPASSVAQRRPVLLAFATGAVPMIAAFILAVLDTVTGVPGWVLATLAGAGPLATGLAALWAQARVTPLNNPRDNDGDPLVPLTQPEPDPS